MLKVAIGKNTCGHQQLHTHYFQEFLGLIIDWLPRIAPCNMPHISFSGNMVIPRSIIALPVNIRKVPHQVVYMIDLVIVDCMDAKNIILGRPFLVRTKAVISMHYLAMRILTSDKVITIKEDQQSARGCYSVISKLNYQTDFNTFSQG